MILLSEYTGLLVAHFFADFMLQTHWQASNKSSNNTALFLHVATYSLMLAIAGVILFGESAQPGALADFIALNFILHFATDWCTSRISRHFWQRQDWHNFFVVIGADQLIHQLTLAVTAWWLLA